MCWLLKLLICVTWTLYVKSSWLPTDTIELVHLHTLMTWTMQIRHPVSIVSAQIRASFLSNLFWFPLCFFITKNSYKKWSVTTNISRKKNYNYSSIWAISSQLREIFRLRRNIVWRNEENMSEEKEFLWNSVAPPIHRITLLRDYFSCPTLNSDYFEVHKLKPN